MTTLANVIASTLRAIGPALPDDILRKQSVTQHASRIGATLVEMQSRGHVMLITQKPSGWVLTEKGKEYYQ